MKKEYLILTALILILSAYIVFHKDNNNTYSLLKINLPQKSKIIKLILGKNNKELIFKKEKEEKWIINTYPANQSLVNNILDAISNLKVSALISSQKKDIKRYQLDNENKIKVKAFENDKKVFEFTIGKTAPSFNHTFVAFKNNPNIYHANGSFRPDFEKSIEDYRDKKILDFEKKSIKKIILKKNKISKKIL